MGAASGVTTAVGAGVGADVGAGVGPAVRIAVGAGVAARTGDIGALPGGSIAGRGIVIAGVGA